MRVGLEEARVQTCETTNRNHIEGLEGRGELAQDSKAHRFDAYGKCGVCAQKVCVLTWGDLHRVRCNWMTTKPGLVPPGYQDPAPWRAARCVSKKEAATSFRRTARPAAMRAVTMQKSAEAIVVVRYFTRVADHEGPNMRSRTEQWAARYSTIKPDRVSRVRRRPMLPTLYAS